MNPTISNTLFHFTGIDHKRSQFKPEKDAFDTLKKILESGYFRLSLNQRIWKIYDENEPARHMDFELPMTCFTETPIEYIGMHMNVFGHFGLGMKINWAIKNHAQNVIYCDRAVPNYYGRTLSGVLDFIHHNLVVDPDTRAKWYWFRSLVGVTEDIVYRNEREWRFLGRSEDKPGGGEDFIPKNVKFTSDDIEVLVCPSKFLLELQQFLENLPNYSESKHIQLINSEELVSKIK